MADESIKPVSIGEYNGVEYFREFDGKISKMDKGEYQYVPETEEIKIGDDWVKVVESREMSIAKAVEYVNNNEDKKIARHGKLCVTGLGLVLAGLITLVGRMYWKEIEPARNFMQSPKALEDQIDYYTVVANQNKTIDEDQKREILFYATRYLQVMEPTIDDILTIGNNIRTYQDNNCDRITELGYILGCDDEVTTYDLLEYLDTTEPVDGISVLSLK